MVLLNNAKGFSFPAIAPHNFTSLTRQDRHNDFEEAPKKNVKY